MSLGGGGASREELQELSQQIERLRGHREELEATLADLEESKSEIDEVIDGLGDLETGSTVQVPMGAGTYVRAEIEDIEEVLVTLGGGYLAELDRDNATEALEDRKEFLDERIEETEAEIEEIEEETEQLEQEAQQTQQQLLQELQQQQAGGGDGGA